MNNEQTPSTKLAVVSLVCGILALIVPCLTVLPAIICGHKAFSRAKKDPANFGGEGMALAGLITGYLGLVTGLIIAILAGMLMPALYKAKGKAQRITCVNNLKQVGIGLRIYATDNQDKIPWQNDGERGTAKYAEPRSDTSALLDTSGKPIFDKNAWRHFQALENELGNPKILRCPSDPNVQQVTSFSNLSANSVSYWLRTDEEVTENNPDEIMVVCPHHDGQFNVLLGDASVHQASPSKLKSFFQSIAKPIEVDP